MNRTLLIVLFAIGALAPEADAGRFLQRIFGGGSRQPAVSYQPRASAADQALKKWDGQWHKMDPNHENYPAWMKESDDEWVSIHPMDEISYATVFKSLTRKNIYYKNGRLDWPRTEKTVWSNGGPGGGRAIARTSELAVMAHAEAWASRRGDHGGYYIVDAKAYHPTGGTVHSRAVADARPTRTSVTIPFVIAGKSRAWSRAKSLARSYEIVDVYEVILLRDGAKYMGQWRDGRWHGSGARGAPDIYGY